MCAVMLKVWFASAFLFLFHLVSRRFGNDYGHCHDSHLLMIPYSQVRRLHNVLRFYVTSFFFVLHPSNNVW